MSTSDPKMMSVVLRFIYSFVNVTLNVAKGLRRFAAGFFGRYAPSE